MILTFLDWFLRRHPKIDDVSRTRARLVVGLLLLNLVALVVISLFLMLWAGLDHRYTPIMLWVLPGTFLLYSFSIYHLSRTLSFLAAGNVFLVGQAASIMSGVLMTGGNTSSPIVPLLVLPCVLAFPLLGRRGGQWWMGIVMLLLCVPLALQLADMQLPLMAHPAHFPFYRAGAPFMLLLAAALALILYEAMNTKLRQALEIERRHLAHRAAHDPLTGLANRDEFLSNLNHAIRESHLRSLHCAVIYMDLDRFKPINDQFGHATGDMVLRATADRLRQCVRGSDMVARLGGDEFAILLMSLMHIDEAREIADKVRDMVQQPIFHASQSLSVGASFGVAVCPEMANTAQELLRLADEAMYNAKRHKRRVQ